MKTLILTLLLFYAIVDVESRKMSSRGRSSGSSRSTSRKSYSHPAPAPTSFSGPSASAPKPSLFGWQEKPARPAQSLSNTQSHSYPSSKTGLSGNKESKQPPTYQESIQRSNIPVQQTVQKSPTQLQGTNQMSHSYPVSNGMSGNAKSSGLSGSGTGYPQQQTGGNAAPGGHQHSNSFTGSNAAPPPYNGYATNSFGNNYHHPQGPPPPYTNVPQSYGGFGGHGYNPSYSPQMPGYFGNYASNSKGFGGMSRTGSALTGVGIAGAGVGTILTGLALWNLARSTGHHHHTVIYDNRGQPVAVAPINGTQPEVDPILGDLVNCTLTISNDNATEVLAVPCAIATSFTPDADVKDSNINNKDANDNTKCIITVVNKSNREFTTTIPCSVLLSTAANNNVTEPPNVISDADINNATLISTDNVSRIQPEALNLSFNNITEYNKKMNCTPEPGEIRDPINPCLSVTTNLTVIPLSTESSVVNR